MSTVVIGANYGDEGKGLITDFEARRSGVSHVVRFNGGAQAGHTVQTKDGKRHVFGHLSSGSFAGADTYLSSDFIVNPLAFEKERASFDVNVLACADARVTTIFDMAVNGLVEQLRGSKRHGSCGMGINETVTRHDLGPRLTLREIKTQQLEAIIEEISTKWIPFRLQQLGIDIRAVPDSALKNVLMGTDFELHASRLRAAAEHFKVLNPIHGETMKSVRHHFDDTPSFVFEGAQGLALDEDFGEFPHVTRSQTGLVGAVRASQVLGHFELSPVYVTRVYLTRHGAGPLEHEGETICDRKLIDLTNKPNEYQGTFRYAPLNLRQLKRLIELDYARGALARDRSFWGASINAPTLAVTCLDQVGEKVRMIGLNGVEVEIPTNKAAEYIADAVGIKLSHSSQGPTAEDVSYHV